MTAPLWRLATADKVPTCWTCRDTGTTTPAAAKLHKPCTECWMGK